jgi:CDP-diacylglycerol--glycerol-3-phosphate 3-phosphatidyltransferase
MKPPLLNLPNNLTILRLLLAIVMFAFIQAAFYLTAMWLFIIAACTDWLDGYLARRYGKITALGRILDPFADKVIICGALVLLAAVPVSDEYSQLIRWGLKPWMVVVIVVRELLVTTLRSFIEREGGDFSARASGKLKMVLQCVAVPSVLLVFSYVQARAPVPDWCWWLMVLSLWSALAVTVYSGVAYVAAAAKLLGKP